MRYSEKEIALITSLDFSWIFESALMPFVAYKMMALDCFVKNKTGPAVESLRRVIKAVDESEPRRLTPEFDSLIEV